MLVEGPRALATLSKVPIVSRRPRLVPLLIAAVVLLILFLPALGNMLTDWWWYQSIGYQIVFTRELATRLLIFAVVGGVTFATIYLNLWLAQRGVVPEPLMVQLGPTSATMNVTAAVRRLSLPVALVFGLLAGLGTTPAWDTVLLALYRTPFDLADPVFSRDIGYYVFTLPGVSLVIGVLFGLTVISLLLLLPTYLFRGDVVLRPRHLQVEPSAGLHLASLLAVLFVLTAVRTWLVDIPGLLYSTTGPLIGASYTDLHASLPAMRVSAVLALVAAGVVLVGGFRQQLAWHAFLGIGGYLAVVLLGQGLYPTVIQKLVVAPTELTRETPYLRNHILATRHAWGLDSVETRDLSGGADLTLADIRANAPTIENVRLWDRGPLLETFGQLQEIRTYYDFISVDDDRYWIDGKYRQVLLSPRELNPASLPTRTFINEHLTFTHGMGLTLGPVNQVTTEGLPVLFVKDLPPVSNVSLTVTRPQIYYGEMESDYVFVATKQREFDHPSGEENVYAAYQGEGGIPAGSLLRRALFAMRWGQSKILFSQDITDQTRVLFYRQIVNRARKALPFLQFDRDPYLVVRDDGTLVWIMDAYTASDRYPYAARTAGGITYMRNSVKLVVDAYTGSLTAYVSVPGDPLIRTWERIFPGIFLPFESMPADLRAHVRYPDDLYRIQATLYTTYHMDSPDDFYHREDQWQIPVVNEPDGSVPFMRHLVMRLPEESKAEFIYMVPFTPRGKDNLAAWMVARNDGDEYGRLRVYQLPRQSLVYGPEQIENRINQDTEISRQVSLWDQRGSKVIRGDLLVIPIEESLLYVQPLYLQAEGGRIPELKRVVVAYQNQVVMQETLEGALSELFGGSATGPARPAAPATAGTTPSPAASEAVRALILEARTHYEAAIQAQRDGDWARYGEEIRLLGAVLQRLAGGGS
jgi:uncharacterized membrane protein (UPF0182 family)